MHIFMPLGKGRKRPRREEIESTDEQQRDELRAELLEDAYKAARDKEQQRLDKRKRKQEQEQEQIRKDEEIYEEYFAAPCDGRN